MKFFIDTANIEEIKKGIEMGLVDGVTTNPILLSKEKKNPDEIIKEILSMGVRLILHDKLHIK